MSDCGAPVWGNAQPAVSTDSTRDKRTPATLLAVGDSYDAAGGPPARFAPTGHVCSIQPQRQRQVQVEEVAVSPSRAFPLPAGYRSRHNL